MSTTALFFEILIIGVQSVVCLALLGYAIVDTSDFVAFAKELKSWSNLSMVAALAFSYSAGLVADRLADAFFMILRPVFYSRPKAALLRLDWVQRKFAEAGRRDKIDVLIKEGEATKFLEYIRSRLRIVRATFLNLLVALAVIPIVVLRKSNELSLPASPATVVAQVWGIGAILLLLVFVSWAMIQVTYDDRLRQVHDAYHKPSSTEGNSEEKRPDENE
ncbi:MAG: hypothetical protein GY722_14190 [bacterium]|nr:hypothetical protein [bacterium]